MAANDEYVLELLINSGVISQTDGDLAQGAAMESGNGVINTLIEQGVVTQADVLQTVAMDCGMEYMLNIESVDPGLLALLTKENALRYKAIPLQRSAMAIQVAISDPLDFETLDTLRYLLKADIEPIVVPEEEIERAITQHYGSTNEQIDALVGDSGDELIVKEHHSDDDEGGGQGEDDAPIIRMVHGIILDAQRLKASDIHIEPMEKRLRLRYRIDGVLQEMRDPPKRLQSSIISRFKIMANVSIAEKRLPQDGRIAINVGDNKKIDLRLSTIPTVHGESIVMRILDKSALVLGLPQLGFFSDDQAIIERVLGYADGIFLVTGPTGSGKSTTLYACLNTINKSDRKLITVEDPVEYQMPGINQVQVSADVGMTFAAALRAMLRQAPNIIMVGEIRDVETATIAINASLTGHLVFSTLHTNDAPSAVTRLTDMGVKPFLVSSSIRAVLAQRLIRTICSKCIEHYTPADSELRILNIPPGTEANFSKGSGCEACRGTGYKGRNGIFEIFTINDEIRTLINEGSSLSNIRQAARDNGMRTLREDGIRKVMGGVTTPEEIARVTMGDKD